MRLACATALTLIATPALAQDATRYTLEKTPGGYVRMDNQNGEMSICAEQSGQLVCKLAADDRKAYHDEIDRLTGRLERLETRVTALEGKPPALQDGLPSEETFEQTMNFMERFFRRFMGVVKEIERENETPPPPSSSPAPPQKT